MDRLGGTILVQDMSGWKLIAESIKRNRLDIVGAINHSSPEVCPAVSRIAEAGRLHLSVILRLLLVLMKVLNKASRSMMVFWIGFIPLVAQDFVDLLQIPNALVSARRVGESSSHSGRGLLDRQSDIGG